MLGGLLIVILPILLRLLVSQSSRRDIGPLIAVAVAALVLLSGYFLSREAETATVPVIQEAQ